MPDPLTHVSIAYLAKLPLAKRSVTFATYAPLFYLGTLLPDWLSRSLYILDQSLFWFVKPLHAPSGLLVSCLILCFFFPRESRKAVFGALSLGVCLHFILDMLQAHIMPDYYWLIPFSWYTWEIPLFEPDHSLYVLPITVALVTALKLKSRNKENKEAQPSASVALRAYK